MHDKKKKALLDLQTIPGVGTEIANDLWNIGIRSVRDIENKNPEHLYNKMCEYERKHIDRCMLYVLRCAVYYTSNTRHDPELLKWWNWKDKLLKGENL